MTKEKFSKEQQKRESFSGVSFDFLETLEVEDEKKKKIFKETTDKLKKMILAYDRTIKYMENAIDVGKFELSDEEYRSSMKSMDDTRVVYHETIINLLNLISRLAKNKEWRESWGTIGTQFERENITKWAIETADYLEKNKNV